LEYSTYVVFVLAFNKLCGGVPSLIIAIAKNHQQKEWHT